MLPKTLPRKRGTDHMIKYYYTTSCGSCRKGKRWLLNNNLEFNEINLITCPPTREEILHMFYLSDDGPEAIISKRCDTYVKLGVDTSKLTTEELVSFIRRYPQVLRRPLVVDETHLQIGFNEDDICQFLPRHIRRAKLAMALEELNTFAETVSPDKIECEFDYLND